MLRGKRRETGKNWEKPEKTGRNREKLGETEKTERNLGKLEETEKTGENRRKLEETERNMRETYES